MKSETFFTGIIAVLFGMIAAMFIVPENKSKIILVISTGLVILFFAYKWIFNKKITAKIFYVFILCSIVGFIRTDQFHKKYPFNAFDQYNNQTITIVGIVHGSPTFKPGIQYVRIQPTTINGNFIKKPTRDIVIKVDDTYSFFSGDQVIVSGKFLLRKNFESDNGRTVEYALMSYSRKIAGDINYPTIDRIIPKDNKSSHVLFEIKNLFLKTVGLLFVPPVSGLLSGIMIGDTSSLDNNLLDTFRTVGLIHIVVLSGYNITLVANFFVRMFSFLGYYRRLVTAMIALVCFIAIVGVSSTAIRAGIMALCTFSARYFIRPYMISRGIALALLVMAWISPYALLFDLSLQLSFLATFGIVYVFPLLQDKYPHISNHMFGEILLQTIAVNVFTLPIIIYYIGSFSLISFPINVIVLVFISGITVMGFLAVFLGSFITVLGRIVAFPVQIVTDAIITISRFTAKHDPFMMRFPIFSAYWVIVFYVIVCVYILNQHINYKKVV